MDSVVELHVLYQSVWCCQTAHRDERSLWMTHISVNIWHSCAIIIMLLIISLFMWHLSSNEKDETIKDIGSWIRRFLTWGSKGNTLDQSSLFNQQSNVRIHVTYVNIQMYIKTSQCLSIYPNIQPVGPSLPLFYVICRIWRTAKIIHCGMLKETGLTGWFWNKAVYFSTVHCGHVPGDSELSKLTTTYITTSTHHILYCSWFDCKGI